MLPHIELDRGFWPLGDKDEHDPDILRAKAAFGQDQMRWSDLLEMTRVVILAEARTGKTHEVRETARRLRSEGKSAFFCRIEDLAAVGLGHAIARGNAREFRSWLEGSDPAWFFLDSVDEARLTNLRYFERALRTLARELDHAVFRAHIFITARMSDWRATADLLLVREVLPPPAPQDQDGSRQLEREPLSSAGQ
jgi:hypothetical protein